MVLLEPPAPADRVLVGRTLAIFSFWSAAARRRMAVRGPPGGVGDEGRPGAAPVAAPAGMGDEGRGEDCRRKRVHISNSREWEQQSYLGAAGHGNDVTACDTPCWRWSLKQKRPSARKSCPIGALTMFSDRMAKCNFQRGITAEFLCVGRWKGDGAFKASLETWN